jgi:hypothetical protein
VSTFVDHVEVPAIATEAAALALLAMQAVITGTVLARQLERACFDTWKSGVERDMGMLRYAAGEPLSTALASSVEAMRTSTALREELEDALQGLLPWCGSVQVREAFQAFHLQDRRLQ